MKNTMTQSEFTAWFANSSERKEQFSYKGLIALYDYLTQLEEDCDTEFEFDPIALCCEYTEYDSALECAKEYGYDEVVDLEPHGSVDLIEVAELEERQAREWLEDRTDVIGVYGDSIIIRQF